MFGTQVIRYFRIINNVDIFFNKVNLLIDVFRNQSLQIFIVKYTGIINS